MGIFDKLFGNNSKPSPQTSGVIDYGKQKNDGSHDHRYDTGNDRTPAQKEGDKKNKNNQG